jgi:multiple sugar transport system permease protein
MTLSAAGRERVLLLAPAALLLAATVAFPMARVVQLSLSEVELRGGIHAAWTGLDGFARLWADSRWWTALANTATFTAVSVVIELALGTAVALLLHRRFRGRGLARTLVVLPWALPTAVMALAWGWIFNDSFGVANDLLVRAGLLGAPVAWLGRPDTAMAALIVADVWKTTPFVTLIALAGLQSIPGEVLEAARVDGLGGGARLSRIVLPLLAPSLLVAAAFRAVQAYATFDLVYVLTGGGPGGATETVSLYAFQNYFRYLDFSYGSVIAVQGVLLLLGAGAAGVLAVGSLRRWTERGEIR